MKIKRWDQFSTAIRFKNKETWLAIDITWCTVYFTVREEKSSVSTDDTGAKIAKVITTHSNPTEWETSFQLTKTETDIVPRDYFYELQVKFTNWDILSTETWILTIVQDLTKSS